MRVHWNKMTNEDFDRELRLAWRRACEVKPHPPILRILNEEGETPMRLRMSWTCHWYLLRDDRGRFVVEGKLGRYRTTVWAGGPGAWKNLLDGKREDG